MPNGFDAGLMYCDSSYANMAEVSVNNLAADRHPRQAASRSSAPASSPAMPPRNTPRGIIQAASGAFGNAATRLAAFVVKGGAFAYGSYPDIDELFPQQADELDHEKRDCDPRKDAAAGPREGDLRADLAARLSSTASARGSASPAFGLIPGFAYTAPFEDITIKGKA